MGEILDGIMTTDTRLYFEREEICSALYKSAREATSGTSGEPVTVVGARKIAERVRRGDICCITTGWRTAYRPYGETDGPLGAVILARALDKACGATPVLLAEDDIAKNLVHVCRAAGLNVLDLEMAKGYDCSVNIKSVPIGQRESKEMIETLFSQLKPSCVISVERPGRNEKGVHHYTRGESCSEGIAYLDYLFEEAWHHKVLTIGIGDLGNELGLGKLRETVCRYIKYGSRCLCPCGGGIAVSDPAEVTVFSTVSNWGAYGIAAALAVVREDLDIFHTGDIERRMLRACVMNGAVDGAFNTPTFSVDTIPEETLAGIVELMRVVAQKGLERKV